MTEDNRPGLEPLLQGYHSRGKNLKWSIEELKTLMDQSTIYKGNAATEKLVSHFGYVNGLAEGLGSSVDSGIVGDEGDIQRRRERYGDNKTVPKKTKTICGIICEQLKDLFVILLCVAAVVSLAVGVLEKGWAEGWLDGVSILVAVSIITVVNTANEYAKEKQFQDLMAKDEQSTSQVIRNGETCLIDSQEVCTGDVILIQKDMRIVADCVLIQGNGMSCDEADLTGEPESRYKTPVLPGTWNDLLAETSPCPFLLKGAVTNAGNGKALVVTVGRATNAGQAEKAMDFEEEPTPLQDKLEKVVEIIGWIGIGAALLTFCAMIIRLICDIFVSEKVSLNDEGNLKRVLNALIIAISVVVMAVPEGLPMAVSIAIAFSVGDLQNEGNLVRKPDATETMGGCHYICTDKTGTLTTSIMTVQSMWLAGEVLEGQSMINYNANPNGKLLAEAVIWNSSAKQVKNEKGELKLDGNPTEKAMINYLQKSDPSINVMDFQAQLTQKMVYNTAFDPKFKYMTTAYKLQNGGVRLLCKGAPDKLVSMCSHQLMGSEVVDMDQEAFQNQQATYAQLTYRTLGVAYKDYTQEEWESAQESHNNLETEEDRRAIDTNFTMIGMFGIEDPLRPGIREAVETHARAGVKTVMVTGDNIETAKAIAYRAGILTQKERDADPSTPLGKFVCMEGNAFAAAVGSYERVMVDGKEKDRIVNSHEFERIVKHLKVMARCSPTHKYLLVTGLIERKNVVAVTGDGTNDAPALSRADVGFAMGTGSDAAKDSSKIVLTGDDFCATVATVKFGRNIYDSVRKFLQFQLTINVVAMTIVFMGACIFGTDVLTSVQILWVNLIMDTFAALALATEPPTDELLKREPQKREESIINAQMWRNIFGWAIMQIIIIFVVLIFGADIFGLTYPPEADFYWTARNYADYGTKDPLPYGEIVIGDATPKLTVYTLAFQTFVFMQLFNQINARKLGRPSNPKTGEVAKEEFNVFEGFFNNWLFLVITLGTFIVQILIVYVGGKFLRVVPLAWQENLFSLGMGFFMLPWTLLVKKIPSRWFSGCKLNDQTGVSTGSMGGAFSKRLSMSINRKLQKKKEEEDKLLKQGLN